MARKTWSMSNHFRPNAVTWCPTILWPKDPNAFQWYGAAKRSAYCTLPWLVEKSSEIGAQRLAVSVHIYIYTHYACHTARIYLRSVIKCVYDRYEYQFLTCHHDSEFRMYLQWMKQPKHYSLSRCHGFLFGWFSHVQLVSSPWIVM